MIVVATVTAACAGASPTVSPSGSAVTKLDVGGVMGQGIVFDFGSLWVAVIDKGTVARIDPATGAAKQIKAGDPAKIPAGVRGGAPSAVTSGFGAIWATGADGTLARIDPATEAVTTFPIGIAGYQLATGEDAVWIGSSQDAALVRFDPAAGKVTNTIRDLGSLFGVATGFGSVWAVNKGSHEVLRIDPRSGAVIAHIAAERNPNFITVGAGSVWVTRAGPLMRIDPATNAVTTIPSEASWGLGAGVRFADGAIWTGWLVRIDPATNRVSGSYAGPYGDSQNAVAIGGGFAWVVGDATLHRVPLALVH